MLFPEILELSVLMFCHWATAFNMWLGMDSMDKSNSSVAILGSYKLSCFLREVGNRNYVAPVTGSDQIRFSPLYLNVQVLELLLAVRKLLSHSCAEISVERGQFFGCWWVEDSLCHLPKGTLLLSPIVLWWSWVCSGGSGLMLHGWPEWKGSVKGAPGQCGVMQILWAVTVLLTVSLGKLLGFPDFQFPFLKVTVVVINLSK